MEITEQGKRLLDILKKDEELCKDIEELKEWCLLYCELLYNEEYIGTPYEVIQDHSIISDWVKKWNEYISWRNWNEQKFKSFIELWKDWPLRIVNKIHKWEKCFSQKDYWCTITILWQANYEHLLRYLEKYGEWWIYTDWTLWGYPEDTHIVKFNLKKPLLEQDEDVLEIVNIYLDNLK